MMIPTVIGAWIGIATASIVMASPIMISLVMLAAVIGLQFAIAAYRNSAIGLLPFETRARCRDLVPV